MFSDYGKRAYIKVIELEKRFESLQKEFKNLLTDTLSFDLSTPEHRVIFGRKFSFVSKDNSTINLTLDLATDVNVTIAYQIVLDGTVINSGNFSNGSGSLKTEIGVGAGVQKFQINLTSPITFGLLNLYVTVSGKVEHVADDRKLSIITLQNLNYITLVNDNRLILYGYDEVEGLYELFNWQGVKDVSICGFIGGELYAIFIDNLNNLSLLIYNPVTFEGINYSLNVKGVTSACGYPYGDGVMVYYVLTGNVYSGVYIKGEKFSSSAVKRRGIKVTAEPNLSGVYIISDGYNSNKFVTDSATYVLDKGKNHHIQKTELGYKITYNLDGALYCEDVEEIVKTPKIVGYADEKLQLFDGKNLIRVREALKISEV